jgi:alpha-L-fucosidase
MAPDLKWFLEARYGLFIHYGLYSSLGRGEWVLQREHLPLDEYKKMAAKFNPDKFDADWLLKKAKQDWGMKYAVLTTKHHEGFCLYDSRLTDFTAPKKCGRDLVAEFVAACRKHNLRIGLYHSLNDWTCSPNATDALNDPAKNHQKFIDYVHAQIREIMTNYGKIDVMWYDGWWPFDANGWQAEKLNAMVRSLQPGILVNGRCALKGDFGTPEGHISPSADPWEACMTLNNSWGFHAGDDEWKSARVVVEMLRQCSAGNGNLLLNVGPRGDGSVPGRSVEILDEAGAWLQDNEEAIRGTIPAHMDLFDSSIGNSDFTHHGRFTFREDAIYLHLRSWPGKTLRIYKFECGVEAVSLLATGTACPFKFSDGLLEVELPDGLNTALPVVVKFKTTGTPRIYNCGGYEHPLVPHCRYDPVSSDLNHGV